MLKMVAEGALQTGPTHPGMCLVNHTFIANDCSKLATEFDNNFFLSRQVTFQIQGGT